MLRLALTLLLGAAGPVGAAENQADETTWVDPWVADDGEAESPIETPKAEAAAALRKGGKGGARATSDRGGSKSAIKAGGSRSAPKSKIYKRRKRSSSGAPVIGYIVPDDHLRETAAERPSGNIHLFSIATKEELKVNIYNPDGSFNVESLDAVSHILRCKRTDAEKEMEPRLLTILSHVYDKFGEKRIEVVSGFRNQRRTSSYHYRGAATDIRVPGVAPKKLQAYVESLDAGGMGVGLYPKTGFVHVDVRPPPSYRWVDYSRSDPDAPDKRPPRGWKKKRKLQS